MKRFTSLFILSFLVLVAYLSPVRINAQETGQTDPLVPPPDDTAQTQPGTTGSNWWWLLPLLAVPFLFLLLPTRDDREETTYRDQGVVGTKGGEARRDRDNEEFMD